MLCCTLVQGEREKVLAAHPEFCSEGARDPVAETRIYGRVVRDPPEAIVFCSGGAVNELGVQSRKSKVEHRAGRAGELWTISSCLCARVLMFYYFIFASN